nr:DUF1127 domain-containing protein [Marinicella sp. W31]MDC2877374.1 DUF1127 domain-containing protein [Marinicella sp. W31]
MTEIPKNQALPSSAVNLVRRLAGLFFNYWPKRRRQRLELLELTEERLRDIGIEPHQVREEANRPFWD